MLALPEFLTAKAVAAAAGLTLAAASVGVAATLPSQQAGDVEFPPAVQDAGPADEAVDGPETADNARTDGADARSNGDVDTSDNEGRADAVIEVLGNGSAPEDGREFGEAVADQASDQEDGSFGQEVADAASDEDGDTGLAEQVHPAAGDRADNADNEGAGNAGNAGNADNENAGNAGDRR